MEYLTRKLSALFMGALLSAPALLSAATLVDLNFDGDSASDGDSLTSTANTGTLGGSATGSISAEYDTSANGSLGAMTTGSGTTDQGNIGYTKGATTANIDWTVAFALRRDGTQSTFNRIWDTEMGLTLQWDGNNSDNIDVIVPNWGLGDIATVDGVWTHIAMTYDHDGAVSNPSMELFVDGVSLGTTTITTMLDFGAAQSFYLLGRGTSGPNRTMSGAIDDFQIHDEVLANVDIETLSHDALNLVPEPGNFALIVGVFGMSFVLLRRPRA
jgi:hypothetical protein